MTRERAAELLLVIAAYAEGKPVQVNYRHNPEKWQDYHGNTAGFDNDSWQWRIKPEPREGGVLGILETKEEAERVNLECKNSLPFFKHEIIHVREVID